MNNIYILKLKDNKYYVGKTNQQIEKKFIQHLYGKCSRWTEKYKPISIEKVITNDLDVDKWIKIYMQIYGINNVRGGSYSKILLDETEIRLLRKETNNSSCNCLFCGEYGHFINNCNIYSNNTVNNNIYKSNYRQKNVKCVKKKNSNIKRKSYIKQIFFKKIF
tara:strand:- start:40 stop:528 length:489 start_codon:yes stop_codon:yes gene_type:complete